MISRSKRLLAIGVEHARHQLVLRIVARGVAHHALFLGQLAFEIERVLPVEVGVLDGGGFAVALFGKRSSRLLRGSHERHFVLGTVYTAPPRACPEAITAKLCDGALRPGRKVTARS